MSFSLIYFGVPLYKIPFGIQSCYSRFKKVCNLISTGNTSILVFHVLFNEIQPLFIISLFQFKCLSAYTVHRRLKNNNNKN
jgi:hypothetical protein